MVRSQLPMAFQGLVVVPLFCGYDEQDGTGRLYTFDVVGGRYEETDYATTGSGGQEAKSFLQATYSADIDEDRRTAPGGRGAGGRRRGGHRHRRARPAARDLPERGDGHVRRVRRGRRRADRRDRGRTCWRADHERCPFYVPPEQLMKDRAEFARKGIARGRSIVAVEYADGVLLLGENPAARCTRSARSTTGSPSPASASTTSSRRCASAASATPISRATRTAATDVTAKGLANAYAQTLGQIFTQEVKPYEVEVMVAEVGERGRSNADLPHPVRRHPRRGGVTSGRSAGARSGSPHCSKQRYEPGVDLAAAVAHGGMPSSRRPTSGASTRATGKRACSTARGRAASSVGSRSTTSASARA